MIVYMPEIRAALFENAQARQGGLHPVNDARALADQGLALAARAPVVLLGQRRDRRHGAMLRLAAQPAKEGALEQLGVESVGLGAPVIPLHRNARAFSWVEESIEGIPTARGSVIHVPSVSLMAGG